MFGRNQRGFTLTEIMIVVTIIGILAAIAFPMFQMVPQRSKSTEAITALGMIRSAMRIYYVEHGTFANPSLFTDGAQVTNGGLLGVSNNDLAGRYFSSECYQVTNGGLLGVSNNDLAGRYFSSECYTFDGDSSANAFTVKCDGGQSVAPFGSEVATIVVTIDEGGDLTRVF
jgi:prepilin-type N-terminal cleavage/methylation domain-containing protein